MGNSIWGPYWSHMDVPRWVPDESLLQNPHRSHMGCPYRTHIITHLGPIWVLYSLLAGLVLLTEPLLLHEVKWQNTFEPRHEKTGFLHMRKQRRRSAVR